jgi:RNA polymerase sigma-70 factor (ECF subfamily)
MSIFRSYPKLGTEVCLSREELSHPEITHALSLEEQVIEYFTALRSPIYSYIYSICENAVESEDLTQEVFLKLVTFLASGRNLDSARAWAFRVAHNLTLNHMKRRRNEVLTDFPSSPLQEDTAHEHSSPNPEQLLAQKRRDLQLSKAMGKLTAHQRQCLHLRAEGFRYREIAEILDLSLWSVADALDRAIKNLRRSVYE